jgi:acetyl esterase/lipase
MRFEPVFAGVASGLPLLLRLGNLLGNGGIAAREISLSPPGVSGSGYRARLYWPEGLASERLPGIYLQHGMTVTGTGDPRMDAFARNLASSGFAVVMPELPSITGLTLDPSSIGEIEALFLEITRRDDLVDGARCGFAAAGFSAGMGLAAMSRPSVRGKVAAVLGVGAYGRFRETVESAVAHLDRDPYGAFLILANFISRVLPDSAALKAALHACASRAFLDQPPLRAEEATDLSDTERSMLASILSDRAYRRSLVLDILARFSPRELELLSPASQLGPVRCPVVLLHGAHDPTVPADEARFLASKLSSAGVEIRLVITTALSHGDREPLWRALPDLPRITAALGRFVDSLRAGPEIALQ